MSPIATRRVRFFYLSLLLPLPMAQAAESDGALAVSELAPVMVTSTQRAQPVFDVPASVSIVRGDTLRDSQMQVNLSETLVRIPGVLAQNRENYAQDLQLSIRGFGSRSTFGVRGIRIYVDGIPATMPDGQGQTSNIDLSSAERIEVLRGPFSALYGNSAGGVIQVFTETGEGPPRITSGFTAGSNGQRRYDLKASGSTGEGAGAFNYLLSVNRYTTNGYRDHSVADKNLGNAKLGIGLSDDSKLTVVLNSVYVKAEDPQGLQYDEFMDSPRSAAPNALLFDTRKTVKQTQGGLIYENRINADNELRLMAYYGQRKTEQFQAIPVATQRPPSHSGGVIDLERNYGGVDARWTSDLQFAGRPLTLIGGIAYDTLREERRGYENFTGSGSTQQLGVKGQLRRNETNDLWNIDPYLQASWEFADRWTLDLGMRYSTVNFRSDDHYIQAGNQDDSGSLRYRKALPMGALRYEATPDLNLYATVGRGFETPTFNELSYRSDGLAGLNLALRPSVNTSVEIGAKARVGDGLLTAALFQTRTEDEIVAADSLGGRSTFRNAGRTLRNGFELSWEGKFAKDWYGVLAYTWLNATYRDSFYAGSESPDNLIPSGNRIPGIAKHALYTAVSWAPPQGWRAGIEGRYLSKIYVNDSNESSAPGYFTAAVHAGYLWRLNQWELNAFARVDNVMDRRYAGAAIINAGFDRYYEPAPGRNWTAGLQASYQF